jgi:6-phosphogluconolactonase (cycloisomerase 2 family)
VVNASGEISAAKVTSVQVQCSTEGFTIGGSVTGLTGSGLVLQDNAGDDLPISASGPFTFLQTVGSGSGYAVTVKTQPLSPGQTCAVTNGSGTVGSANVTNVLVTCTTTINKYTVSVAVSGLQAGATGLRLLDNGGDSLSITGNNTFTFATAITSGQPYAVTVGMQPTATPAQYCIVQNGSGTVTTANITNVTLTCRRVGQALFVANSQDGAGNTGSVGGYTIDPATGVLTAAIGSPFTAANTDLNPNSVTLDVSGQYAYVANLNSSNVSTFSVSTSAGVPTGALAFSADTATSAAPPYKTFTVAVSPNGSYAFVGSDENPEGIVDAYTLSGGALTSVGPATTAGNDPVAMVVDPSNRFLFAPEQYDPDIAVFSIGAGGALSPATHYACGPGPVGVALRPPSNGQPGEIYVANSGDGTVWAFTYDSTSGALATVGLPYSVGSGAGSGPSAITIDPTGRFVYVTAYADNTVSEFSINPANGQLTPVGAPVPTGLSPQDVKIEPSGHFAYVANRFGNTINVFTIDPTTGALTLISSGGTVATGTQPMSMAIE